MSKSKPITPVLVSNHCTGRSLPSRPVALLGVAPAPGGPADLAGCLPGGVTLGDRRPLVVAAPAPGQGEGDLGPAVLEVEGEGDEGQRLLLGTTGQLVDLPAVQEQLAGPVRIVAAETLGEGVGGDMDPVQPHLAVLDPGVGIPQRHQPVAEGLDLAALQGDAALDGLEDVVVVAGLAVDGH